MASNYGTSVSERLKTPVSQWQEALGAFGRRLRVALPGIIQSFDETNQTVTVQPAVNEVERIAGTLTTITLPLLVDVPIVLPRAGGYTLTFPIEEGDECLVVFSDTCIDGWWQSGGQQNQPKQRRHSLADAFAIFGTWNHTRVLSDYSTSSTQLRNDEGNVTVDVSGSQITLTAPTVTVNASSQINLNAPTIDIAATSALNLSTNTKIDNKTFLTHEHSGVATGGSDTGAVV